MYVIGEVDTRFSFCALATVALLVSIDILIRLMPIPVVSYLDHHTGIVVSESILTL